VMLGGPNTFVDPEENRLIEAGRGTASAGHGIDRIWQMWLEEAMPATSSEKAQDRR
jgi:hypothetical protein